MPKIATKPLSLGCKQGTLIFWPPKRETRSFCCVSSSVLIPCFCFPNMNTEGLRQKIVMNHSKQENMEKDSGFPVPYPMCINFPSLSPCLLLCLKIDSISCVNQVFSFGLQAFLFWVSLLGHLPKGLPSHQRKFPD